MSQIVSNWESLRKEVDSLTSRKVQILAVSKTRPISEIEEALQNGISAFGENKIQEGTDKFSELKEKGYSFELHHIGPVQSGTLKKLFGLFSFTHGVGSISTLEALSKQSLKSKQNLGFFLQANLTLEDSKSGLVRKDLESVLKNIQKYETEYLRFSGLMTMGPTDEDRVHTRKVFKELFSIRRDFVPNCLLSMGMSGDFDLAIEEGADIIRVGSRIFGSRS